MIIKKQSISSESLFAVGTNEGNYYLDGGWLLNSNDDQFEHYVHSSTKSQWTTADLVGYLVREFNATVVA